MEKLTLNIAELSLIPAAIVVKGESKQVFNKVVIDSRKAAENCLFVAIKGDNFDGHDFIKDVIKSGAVGIVIDKSRIKEFENLNTSIIAVDDTIIAFGQIAKLWRKKLNAKVISITGSNGKTSTKEYLSTMLSTIYNVVKTEGNNNNHIGVPLTILEADEKTEMLVLEHGTNHFNEISYTAAIAQPDFGLITNIGDSHLEFLMDKNGVLEEKYALIEETIKNDGYVFINLDDKLITKKAKSIPNKISFSFSKDADVRGKVLGTDKKGRTELWISFRNTVLECSLPIYGNANAKNVLAAVSIAQMLGLSKKDIYSGIKNLQSIKGRTQVSELKKYFLIDDTYNANPDSMKAALQLVSKVTFTTKKVAIIGDMFELGEESENLHKEVAQAIRKSDLTDLILVGTKTELIANELKNSSVKVNYFTEKEKIYKFLDESNLVNSVILVKGSRGMRMEEFVNYLKERGN
ncbi:MAG: UDP-N-acetylmuramoyl-tripeptide--D-alanyl-D-alanine ligase [bacterium]